MKFNKLIPELMVKDIEKSLEFYKNIGFNVDYSREKFVFLSYQGSQIMLEQNEDWKTAELEYPYGRGINFQIEANVDEVLSKLKDYPLFRELEENSYEVKGIQMKCKEFLVQDPDGYLLRFSEDV
ncbi:VOC family protein [Nanoarchaeota archaeon]